jgi:hypothetical protein
MKPFSTVILLVNIIIIIKDLNNKINIKQEMEDIHSAKNEWAVERYITEGLRCDLYDKYVTFYLFLIGWVYVFMYRQRIMKPFSML